MTRINVRDDRGEELEYVVDVRDCKGCRMPGRTQEEYCFRGRCPVRDGRYQEAERMVAD